MEINFLGHSSFKIKGKGATVVTDPYDPKRVGLKFPRVKADIVTVSHDHFDHNNTDAVDKVKMVIVRPGEYEVSGVSIIGISTYHDDKKGKKRGSNNVYVLEIDDLRLVHLGDLGHKLSEKQIDAVGTTDILMIPVGGEYTIGPKQAAEVVHSIEPTIVIPMHYKMEGLDEKSFSKLAKPETFLSNVNIPVEKKDKLTVRKEIIGENQRVVLLAV
ncbi:MAG: MBL fold metallo-hydrolase [Candidatus Woesebacteria bacterium]|jgi:L-ascorbate metabolism protein UlaG (beta-lactamase superfamily)